MFDARRLCKWRGVWTQPQQCTFNRWWISRGVCWACCCCRIQADLYMAAESPIRWLWWSWQRSWTFLSLLVIVAFPSKASQRVNMRLYIPPRLQTYLWRNIWSLVTCSYDVDAWLWCIYIPGTKAVQGISAMRTVQSIDWTSEDDLFLSLNHKFIKKALKGTSGHLHWCNCLQTNQ